MASTAVDSQRTDQLIIYGYLRNIINAENDYSFILAIILLFYQQGFAKYYDENIVKDYKQKMRFGDLVKAKNNDIMVLNINHELVKVGSYSCEDEYDDDEKEFDIYITIPLSICQHLVNAVSFYTVLSEMEISNACDEYRFDLYVKHNDQWIIKHFDGPLDSDYEDIRIDHAHGKFDGVCITFFHNDHYSWSHCFDPIKKKISHKDVKMFHELRKDKENLIKLKASLTYQQYQLFGECEVVSTLWDFTCEHDYSYGDTYVRLFYVGPKFERNKMISKLKGVYRDAFNDIVSFEELRRFDYIW